MAGVTFMPDIFSPGGPFAVRGCHADFRPLTKTDNAFCATGVGGGVDATCSPGKGAGGAAVSAKAFRAKNDSNPLLPTETRAAYTDKMSKDQRESLNEYSWNLFDGINAQLRGGKSQAGNASHIKNIDEVFAATPEMSTPTTTYRGVSSTKMPGGSKAFIASLEKAATSGAPITYSGYASTTTNQKFALNEFTNWNGVVMEIKAVHGIDMRPYSQIPKEDELLLPHNSTFVVKSVTVKTNTDTQEEYHHVVMEQVRKGAKS